MTKIIISPTNVELLENGFIGRVAHNGTIEVFNNEGKTIEQFKKEEVINSKFLNNIFLKEMVLFDKNIKTNNYNFLRYDFSIEEVSKMNKDAQIQLDDYSFSDVIRFNSSQIDELMKNFDMKNTRISKEDFDGGHFSGDFDTRLNDMGYVRLCVERTSLNDELMILVEKEILDNLIKKNYSYDVLFECEKAYTTENHEAYEDFVNAYFEMYEPIIKDLNLNIEDISMYIDGIDYIQDESEKLGYTFGKEKFSKSLSENLISIENRPSIEEAKKLLEKHSSPSIELQ